MDLQVDGTRRFGRRVLALVAGAAVIALAGCHGDDKPADATTPAPESVIVTPVQDKTVPITVDFVAQTQANVSVDVRARVEAVLESVDFQQGTIVQKGQLLFSLQKDQYEAALLSAQASLAKGNADLQKAVNAVPVLRAEADLAKQQANLNLQNITVNRYRPLAQKQAISQQDLDNAIGAQEAAAANVAAAQANLADTKLTQQTEILTAKAEIMSASADVANAKINLSYCTIYAPVTGLIGILQIDQGNLVGQPGEKNILVSIGTVDPMKVVFSIPETDYLYLFRQQSGEIAGNPGQRQLTLTLADGTRYPYTGTFSTLARELNNTTGTLTVEALFPNPNGLLRPGQFGKISGVGEERKNSLLIPQTAVAQLQGTTVVYVVDKQTHVVQQRTVSVGPMYQNMNVITGGVQAGELVIVQGVSKVAPGETVNPVLAKAG